MTKDEASAAAEELAKPTWDKPVQVGWHSSVLGYGHITVDGNDIADVQFYGAIDDADPSEEELGYFVESVRATVALAEEVNAHRTRYDELERRWEERERR